MPGRPDFWLALVFTCAGTWFLADALWLNLPGSAGEKSILVALALLALAAPCWLASILSLFHRATLARIVLGSVVLFLGAYLLLHYGFPLLNR